MVGNSDFLRCSVFAALFLKWFLSMTVRHAPKPVKEATLKKHCISKKSELPTTSYDDQY